MIGIRGIIYDCDGVLFESRQANLAYYNAILDMFGEAPVDASDHARAHLCHTAASPRVLAELLGEERSEQALSLAANLDYRQFIPYMTPEPGMKEALSRLARAFPLAVATNRGTSMPSIIEHFGLTGLFRTIVTSKDVSRPKPAPDMLLEVARRLQCATNELLFVGDSELDQAAAKEAGMPFSVYRGDLDAELRLEHHAELAELLLNGDGRREAGPAGSQTE